MAEHYTRDHFRDHSHVGIPIKESTDGESLAVWLVM